MAAGGFSYKDRGNLSHVAAGRAALRLHPDSDGTEDDREMAAADMIANVLHALHAKDADLEVAAVLARAARTYDGDLTDEPKETT